MGLNSIVLIFICVLFGFIHNESDFLIKEIFSIEEHTWILKSGMDKGKWHDRQDLGIILMSNTTLVVRQANPETHMKITVRMMGEDTHDIVKKVGSEWVQLISDTPRVPFIDTPFGFKNITIHYKIIGLTKPLLTYKEGCNYTNFFADWDHYNTSYTLVKNQYFQLLIPKSNKKLAKNLKNVGYDLDNLILHYEDLFSFYNELVGLDDSSPTDRKTKNRFFLRGDNKCRKGLAAYYSNWWTANCWGAAEAWLGGGDKWIHLHEIGHGYEPKIKGTSLVDTANNQFAMIYLYLRQDQEGIRDYWISQKKRIENGFMKNMKIYNGAYEKMKSVFHKLVLLLMLTEKAGIQALTNMYKAHRLEANMSLKQRVFSDLLNRHYSDYAQLDFAPALEQMGLSVEPEESLQNRQRGYRAVAHLTHVVPDSSIPAALDLLNKSQHIVDVNEYTLVTNDDISSLGLSGDLVITIPNISILNISGQITVKIKDGNKEVATQTVAANNHKVYFDNLPNGVYSVEKIHSKFEKLQIDSYVYVKSDDN